MVDVVEVIRGCQRDALSAIEFDQGCVDGVQFR